MKKSRRFMSLTVLRLVIAVLVLASCMPVTPTPPSEPPPPPDLKPVSYCISLEQSEIQEVATDEGFISGQIVLQGLRASLDIVAEREGLTLIQICPVESEPYDPENPGDPNHPDNPQAMVIGLYEIQNPDEPGRNAKELVLSINDNQDYPDVEADLNYLVTSSAGGSCVDPYSIGGSPYSIGGSPNDTLNETVPANQFLRQWALGNIGFTYSPPVGVNDVHVGIFDTAPSIMLPGNIGMSVVPPLLTVEWPNAANNDRNFYLKVYDFIGNNTQISSESGSPPPPDFSSHGLFIAGQGRMIAPESQFHLIRVMGDNGCGDSFRLSAAINNFMALMRSNGVKKVVINLSLTARALDDSVGIPYLKAALENAHSKDEAVIIAAVGNDSTSSSPMAAQIPASYDFVIGVVSANREGGRACYSNKGDSSNKDTSAPGGNGGEDPTTGSGCASRTITWDKNPNPCPLPMGQCRYMLISLIKPTKDPSSSIFRTGFGGWSGSSFAAGWVSGAAARVYAQSASQSQVYCRIEKGSTLVPTPTPTPPPAPDPDPALELGWGVINVANIMADRTCPATVE